MPRSLDYAARRAGMRRGGKNRAASLGMTDLSLELKVVVEILRPQKARVQDDRVLYVAKFAVQANGYS